MRCNRLLKTNSYNLIPNDMPPLSPQQPQYPQYPQYPQGGSSSYDGEMFSKQTLWLIIGAVAIFTVVVVAVLFSSSAKSEDEIKAAILRSLSAPGTTPEISAEEKRQILESLSAPSSAPEISAEEKQAILNSLSAPSQ